MNKAYLIRGQGIGILTKKVYLDFPPEEDMRAALAQELNVPANALNIVRNEDGSIADIKAKTRWIRVETIEVVGTTVKRNDKVPETAVHEVTGALDRPAIDALIERAKASPADAAKAEKPEIVFEGEGKVINPGDPGFQESKR